MSVLGILGKKVGMTQVFLEDGRPVPVTAVRAGPCVITLVRTQGKDGYEAAQLGFEEVKALNKPLRGHLKRAGKLFRHLREVPVGDVGAIQVGQRVDAGIFQPGERVDVSGTCKGRGFTGVVKRHGFAGGPKTHGQSDRHRAPGSIGATTFPGRVLKGTRMAGHWGDERVTVGNLEVVKVEPERVLLFLKGAVPGPAKGLLLIRKRAVKGEAQR